MPTPHSHTWTEFHEKISAGEQHLRELPAQRGVWSIDVTQPALVLGSRQQESLLNTQRCALDGIDIVRRRSGGGVVYLAPGEQVWIDVVIPRGDALWSDDVAQASWWLGETWLSALGSLGVTDLDVHRDSVHSDAWGELLCFAGVGPGEVISTRGDKRAKVVGISQRRTRDYARFQCTIYMKWNPHHLAHYFESLPGAVDEVVPRVVTINADASTIVETFVAHLPR